MSARTAFILVALTVIALSACGGAPPPPAKMSSTTASNDQFASCPAESSVVGGGYEISAAARTAGKIPMVVVNRPTESGWRVECVDEEGKTTASCKAFVVCATVLR